MMLEVKQDPRRPAGYAWIEIGAALPPGRPSFRIEREHGSKPHLGPNGWQATRAELAPRDVSYTDTGVRLVVGPEVVNHIAEYEQIRLQVPAISFEASAVWPPIPPLRTGRHVIVAESTRPVETMIDAPPTEPAQVVSRPAPQPPELPVAAPDDLPGPTASVETHPKIDPTARVPFVTRIGTAILAVALVFGALAYFYSDRLFGPRPGPAIPHPRDPAEPVILAGGRPAWERMITDPNTDPDRLLELGLALAGAPQPEMALAFEALTRAAERGKGGASLWIARAYDPRYETWRHVFGDQPNAINALRHYQAASSNGASEAQTEIRGLCLWLSSRPRGGSDVERAAFEGSCRL